MFWVLQIWQLSIKTSKLTIFSIVFCEGYCVKNSPSPICANLCSWKNFLIKIEVFYTFAEKITAGSTKVAIWDHFWKKLSFMKTYISQAMFSFSLFQTSLIYFPPYFCIVVKSLRIGMDIKQDKIAHSLECLTKKCDFSSCTGSNPVSDIMFLFLIFWTLFELCTRANIDLWSLNPNQTELFGPLRNWGGRRKVFKAIF